MLSPFTTGLHLVQPFDFTEFHLNSVECQRLVPGLDKLRPACQIISCREMLFCFVYTQKSIQKYNCFLLHPKVVESKILAPNSALCENGSKRLSWEQEEKGKSGVLFSPYPTHQGLFSFFLSENGHLGLCFGQTFFALRLPFPKCSYHDLRKIYIHFKKY